ncbi:hypothetical protein [Aneurinibacillus aneurinilyticus]|uniref:hypothetical protein n=1 Tax=Aneurinibacillus aneurinilyticus TaxID=1391 RepID=UPI0023F1EBF1|nr:hypothetical protein [Aneurinibacillus aneurinilyticus]
MKKKGKISLVLLLSLFSFYLVSSYAIIAVPVHAEDTKSSSLKPSSGTGKSQGSSSDTGTGGAEGDSGEGVGGGVGSGGGGGWIDSLINAINELIESIKRIATGEAIKEFFLNWIADWMQELLNMWLKVLGFAFVKIPSFVGQGNWIHTSWGIIVWCTVPFLLLGMFLSAYRIMKGNDVARAKSLLWVLVLTTMFSFYSLTLFDYFIKLCNYFLSEALAETFTKLNEQLANAKSAELQGFTISFDNMSGAQATYLILVGPDGEQSLMRQLLASCGLWFSQFQGLVLFLLSFSTLLMYGVLIVLAIFAPFWAGWSAMSGRPEPVIGLGNLLLRCFAVKFLYSFTWRWMAERQMGAEGEDVILNLVSATVLNTLVIILLLIVTWFIFWRHTFRAAAQPVYLNGAGTLEGFGKTTSRMSKGLKAVASSFGVPISKGNDDTFSRMVNKLDTLSESSSKKAEKWKEKGEELQAKKDDSFWEKLSSNTPFNNPALSYTKRKENQTPGFVEEIQEMDEQLDSGVTLSGEYHVFQSQQNVEEIENRVQLHNQKLQHEIDVKKEAAEKMAQEIMEIQEKQRLAQEEMKGVTESMKQEDDPSAMASKVAHRDYLTKQLNEWYEKVRSLQENIEKNKKSLAASEKEKEENTIAYKKENGQMHVYARKGDEAQAERIRELFQESLHEKRPRYWKHASGGYVIIQEGLAMKTDAKPEDGVEMGLWKG